MVVRCTCGVEYLFSFYACCEAKYKAETNTGGGGCGFRSPPRPHYSVIVYTNLYHPNRRSRRCSLLPYLIVRATDPAFLLQRTNMGVVVSVRFPLGAFGLRIVNVILKLATQTIVVCVEPDDDPHQC